MDGLEYMEAKIEALKKKLTSDTNAYQKALTVSGGYEEAKRLLKNARAIEEELKAAIDIYNNLGK